MRWKTETSPEIEIEIESPFDSLLDSSFQNLQDLFEFVRQFLRA